jgi:hypothetical protein
MSEIIREGLGYCGLICKTCPIYQATRVKDKKEQEKMRTEIARLCREEYGLNYDVKDISDCDGCRTENERVFTACKNCKIRICARERGFENCAFCPEFVCDNLEVFYARDPSAKANLDQIRSNIV